MLAVNEATVRSVVEQVLAQLLAPAAGAPKSGGTGSAGVHASVDDAVAAAKAAYEKFQLCSLDQRKAAVAKIREICIQQAQELGRAELDETKIGRLDHKIEKLIVNGERTPGVEFLQTQAWSGDNGLSVQELAPFGVIAAITPVTHSLPTLAGNAISMLAAGNTVVFNAHPSGANIAREGLRRFNQAIRAQIGVDNLINIVDPPSIETAQALFEHRDVRLIVVTGGPAVARAAMASRKRAIVAGPGNPPVVVDETACIANAAKSIIKGGAYDNNLLCIGEKEVFAVHVIFDQLMTAFAHHGGFRLNDQQVRDLEQAMFVPAGDGSTKVVVRKEFIGKDPALLAKAIGLTVPTGVQLLFGETGEHSPFVDHEQMMPFVPVVRVPDADTGIALAKRFEHNFKHTAIIHSRNLRNVTKMARELDTTIFVVNGPSMAGLGVGGEGYLSYSIATPTGEGVTTPLTFSRQRRCAVINDLRIV
jgi:aldehyde dehydrogenase